MDFQKFVDQTRADHPNGECVVAYRGSDPVLLAVGEGLSNNTCPGAVLARLLSQPGDGPWVIVTHRRGRAPVKRFEQFAAFRIQSAARLVDVPLAAIVLSHGGRVSVLISAE